MQCTAPDPPELRTPRTTPFIVGQIIALLAAIASYVWCRPILGLSIERSLFPACLFFAIVSWWCLWSWKRVNGALFEPYGMFLVAVILFNGGQAILEVFHLNGTGLLGGAFSPEITFAALYLVTLGLIVLHLGALISVGLGDEPSPVDASPAAVTETSSVRFVGWVLLLISALPAVLVLSEAVSIVLSAGYLALYQQDNGTGLNAGPRVLADFLVPASLFLLVGSKDSRRDRLVSAVVVASSAMIQLFLGGRYNALMPLIAYIWLWHRSIRPIPRALLWGASAFVFVIVLPLVSATRDISGADRLSPAVLFHAFTSIQNPLVAIVSEMGSTMRVDAHMLVLVPDVRPYDHGASYGYAVLSLLPNLFWSVHPSIAHGTVSNWLVWQVEPGFAKRGGGLGLSLIAEAFLNFGWIGAPIILGLIGFGYARLIRWGTTSGAPSRLATVATIAASFTFYARSEAGEVLRPLVWYALLPYALVCIVAHANARLTAQKSVSRGHADARLREDGEGTA